MMQPGGDWDDRVVWLAEEAAERATAHEQPSDHEDVPSLWEVWHFLRRPLIAAAVLFVILAVIYW